ncbi:FxLYD domain-containing protein [Caldanaerobius polysaccharolyticus]|uniref:FxLYD domain-containing protein n=1 Tax=Caldanaerobius polysaccharolyticus TaxID=44256 RepID=UPI0004798CD5|nr:FxLYD domain-containing protein [Caldanaerobius polysaccharolyticus]
MRLKNWRFWIVAMVIVIAIIAAFEGCGASDQSARVTTGNIASSDAKTGKDTVKPKELITFSNVVLHTEGGVTTVNGEAKNNDNEMHSFTLKVSFYDASKKLLGTAVGAVNELAPGDTKIFTAMATEDYSKAASYKVEVDTMVQSVKSYTRPKIEFSNIVVKGQMGVTQVDGEVKNGDSVKHSFTLVVGFYDGNGKLLGTAAGAVNDLDAGSTKTFTAMSSGDYSKAANVKVQIDSMVE